MKNNIKLIMTCTCTFYLKFIPTKLNRKKKHKIYVSFSKNNDTFYTFVYFFM